MMKYWTIKLSVEKVEKDSFLRDISRAEPQNTYVLSYKTPEGLRHAVYVESYSENHVHCLNSWGNIERTPRIGIEKIGNIFYRVFCTTYIVLSSSVQKIGRQMGVFEYLKNHNNSPAYRQKPTVDTGKRVYYLYKHYSGVWCVGKELDGSTVSLRNGARSDSVPTSNWIRRSAGNGLQTLPELKLSTCLSPVYDIKTVEEAETDLSAGLWPDATGEYRATGA